MTVKFTISSTEELSVTASSILKFCTNKKIFAFLGEMGSGKTTLIQALCKVLGVNEMATSPTFAIVNEYRKGQPVYHIDLYRLHTIQEAWDIGIEEYLSGSDYCFIEWPQLILPLLPEETVFITIEIMPNQHRMITVNNP